MYKHSMLPNQEIGKQVLTLEKSENFQEEKEVINKLLNDLQIDDNEVLTPDLKEKLKELIVEYKYVFFGARK